MAAAATTVSSGTMTSCWCSATEVQRRNWPRKGLVVPSPPVVGPRSWRSPEPAGSFYLGATPCGCFAKNFDGNDFERLGRRRLPYLLPLAIVSEAAAQFFA